LQKKHSSEGENSFGPNQQDVSDVAMNAFSNAHLDDKCILFFGLTSFCSLNELNIWKPFRLLRIARKIRIHLPVTFSRHVATTESPVLRPKQWSRRTLLPAEVAAIPSAVESLVVW